jgi:hypothetical protein
MVQPMVVIVEWPELILPITSAQSFGEPGRANGAPPCYEDRLVTLNPTACSRTCVNPKVGAGLA